MSDQVQLKVAGRLYAGWKAVRIEIGIEQAAGAFDVSVSDRWSEQSEPWPIHPGEACEVVLNGKAVINGFIDEARPSFDRSNHGIYISGRDKTQDLIDCSAIFKTGQWKGAKLDKIAADIAKPFGIEVVVSAGVNIGAAFDSFNIEDGERAFEAIERAARMRGVLVMTDGAGMLLLSTASTEKTDAELTQGVNVLQAELVLSCKERFSKITVKGQGKGTADSYGAKVAHGQASTTDTAITRYRPLIVIAEQHGQGPSFTDRAEWERNVRRGRGTRAVVKVPGWTYAAGAIWRPNTLVGVNLPYLGLQQDMLIVKCLYTIDERAGSVTELQLVDPSAVQQLKGVRGTALSRRISGKDGLASNRKAAKAKAKKGPGVIIDPATGRELTETTP